MTRLSVLMIAACPFPAPRGTPIRILKLSESIANIGHDVHVLTYHLGEPVENDQLTVHRIGNIPIYQRYVSGPSYLKLWVDFKLAMALRKLLKERTFDIIHAHHYEGLLASLIGKGRVKIPLIFDAHTLAAVELPDYSLGIPIRLKRWIGEQFDRRLPGLADYCITASHTLENALVSINAVRPDRIATVRNGVELEHFARKRRQRHPNDTRRIVFTGNLAPYQGLDLLMKMFSRLSAIRDNVTLIIVTNDSTEALRVSLESHGILDRVVLKEANFADLPEHLASADVAINPRPQCDGVPQKLLNYMSAGCPIVSLSGSAQHLRNEKSALLVDEPSSDALLQAVLRLLDSPELAATLGHNAREIARRKLSWEAVASDAVKVYSSLLN